VSDWEAEFRWNNPPQTIEPTHTQVRILSGASIWQTIEYPAGGQFWWGGLSPSTSYEFQVRLIRIEDNVITDFSPLR
ncbi:hypothetical protein, partial [Salmonella sp. SAL4457]|uniref:hypothetical protein n=1 Tax=Salmonella sp. SAL4457 TaxID=3159912 RepID=UPI00397D0A2B